MDVNQGVRRSLWHENCERCQQLLVSKGSEEEDERYENGLFYDLVEDADLQIMYCIDKIFARLRDHIGNDGPQLPCSHKFSGYMRKIKRLLEYREHLAATMDPITLIDPSTIPVIFNLIDEIIPIHKKMKVADQTDFEENLAYLRDEAENYMKKLAHLASLLKEDTFAVKINNRFYDVDGPELQYLGGQAIKVVNSVTPKQRALSRLAFFIAHPLCPVPAPAVPESKPRGKAAPGRKRKKH